ncbi:hypothetical protein NE237_001660 [Protea cynaroides]|uniref:Uncharacterized protein n=1 Tax=Protea cynaroides TaxID=273540 RepID=A0A9Q0KUJ9_9MAGN|nr:hypothetical protein NE237_001660 [Protea cynaroides]
MGKEEFEAMAREDLDGNGALNEMFCILMVRLSPWMMQDAKAWLQKAPPSEAATLCLVSFCIPLSDIVVSNKLNDFEPVLDCQILSTHYYRYQRQTNDKLLLNVQNDSIDPSPTTNHHPITPPSFPYHDHPVGSQMEV